MKLLFVTPYLPGITKSRPHNILKHLARSHEIHLVAFNPASQGARERADFLELSELCASVTILQLPRWRRYANVIGGLPTPTPARVGYYHGRRFSNHILAAAEYAAADAIWVDRLRIAGFCAQIPVPKVVDATDCISEYLRQCIPHMGPFLRPAYALEYQKTQRYERHAADNYDYCVVTTERERALYASAAYAPRTRTIPNILDHRLFDTDVPPARDTSSPLVVFAGTMSYFPNHDAAQHLLRRIWPRVKAALPSARLVIAGDAPPASLARLAQACEAEVTGFVPDLRGLVAGADLVVSPMRIAVGFPNKVAESLALARPVVATRRGCAGLSGSENALVVADDPATFAAAVIRLLSSPDERDRLAHAARAYAFSQFHPSLVTNMLDDLVSSLSETQAVTQRVAPR